MSAQPPAKKASLIEKETDEALYEKANVEYRIMNIECRRIVLYLFYKKIERSESALRNSAVRYSAVRCLIQAKVTANFHHLRLEAINLALELESIRVQK